jgi:hypothetical protein
MKYILLDVPFSLIRKTESILEIFLVAIQQLLKQDGTTRRLMAATIAQMRAIRSKDRY